MTYNENFFSKEDNTIYLDGLNDIIRKNIELLDILKELLFSGNEIVQKPGFESFFHLLRKIRFNMDSSTKLLECLKEDYRYKVSTNVLYRSIIDDLINFYYLLCFIDDENSLNNELDVLHLEFCTSSIKIAEAELLFNSIMYAQDSSFDKERFKNDFEKFKNDIKLENPELENKKKHDALRRTTSQKLLDLDPPKGTYIGEQVKIDFIKTFIKSKDREFKVEQYDRLTILFKYFSQFQHYTPKADELLLDKIGFDLKCYRLTIIDIHNVMRISTKMLVLNNPDVISNKIKSFDM